MSVVDLSQLGQMDRRLASACGPLQSLCPDRAEATTLAVLGARAVELDAPEAVGAAYVRGLLRIAESQIRNFPDNLFWDLDYPAERLLAEGMSPGVTPEAGAKRIDEASRLVEALEAAFGCRTAIHFRYVHDFVYGFDWARWVQAAPEARRGVGPFDRPFLEYLLGRAAEIDALIQKGDDKYGPLADGEDRNPFGFAREPKEEALLHRDLAARGLIPVEAWRYDAEPAWDRPFSALREERAEALGLIKKP